LDKSKDMIRNYFKTAWRNLRRQRAFAAINIVGLAIGLATCLLIGLFVFDEWSYDRFHEKADRIVRVVFKGEVQGGKLNEAHVMPPTARVIAAEYPEVALATRLRNAGKPHFLVGDKHFRDEAMAFVDPNFFSVFTLPLLQGDPATALTKPNTVVISESVAKAYFGDTDPMGQALRVKDGEPVYVMGVMADVPTNSHLQFDLFASMATLPDAQSTSWMESEYYTYLVLREGYDYKLLEAKLPETFEKHISPQFLQAFGMSYTEYRKAGNAIGLYLQPLTDIHLRSDFAYDLGTPSDIRYVYIFGAIAVFMLLIASINFMNLSTAAASKRAKEVGVRKVLGSGRKSLVYQFLIESFLLTLAALVLAVALAYVALPLFNQLAGKTLTLHVLGQWQIWPILLLLGIVVALLAGCYPAFFLSAFNPVSVLKGKLAPANRGLGLRSGLVVFQFLISIGLIFCTTVVYKQLDYIQNKKLGYNKEQVLVLQTWTLGKQEEAFRQQLLQDSRVMSVTNSPYVPAGPTYNNNFFVYPEDSPQQGIKTLRYEVDEHYIPTLGIELKSGRNFSPSFGTDSSAVIINEKAAETLGWTDNALGQRIFPAGAQVDSAGLHVIGVVNDFHFKSLHEPITPLVMVLNENFGNLIVKAQPGNPSALLQTMEKRYNAFNVDMPFSYSFLDDRIDNTYQAENKTGTILGIFAGLTIFVACLGLFGLATFTAYQRTKEIGIRKVLGATVANIIRLLIHDFVKLIGIALVIASPIAWWVMNNWLEDFAYRITIEWWVFAVAGLAAVAIALITVSWQAIHAAVANPGDSLRNE